MHGAAPAPYRALDLIEGAAAWSLEEGYRAEEDALAELLPGREAQASVYAFNLVERRAKRGVGMPDAEPRRVQKVGIVGAGLMARQLALLFLRRLEVPVVLRDLTQEQVDDGIAWIHDELADLVKRGRLGEGKARFLGSIVTGGTDWDVFAGCDLVLEAVFEEMAVKKEVFAELERRRLARVRARDEHVVALGDRDGPQLEHPERVVGMHFFNPVAVLPLVELVRTPSTDDVTLATAWAVHEEAAQDRRARAGRDRVRRQPTPRPPGLGHHGGARPRQHGRGDGRGRAADGPADGAVCPPPARRPEGREPRAAPLHDAWPDRFPLSQTLESLAEGGDVVVVEDAPRTVDELHGPCSRRSPTSRATSSRTASSPTAADIDTCLLLGAGFPFWLGGITKHLDQTGVSERVVGRPLAEIGHTFLKRSP